MSLSYLAEFPNRCRPLSREEERTTWEAYRAGDVEAQRRLVTSILPWIVVVARRYARRQQDLDELVAEGNYYVCAKLHRFDPAKGRLTTWVDKILCRHYYRLRRSSQPLSAIEMEAHSQRLSYTVDQVDELHRAERVAEVRRAIASLRNRRDRTVIERRMQEHTFVAIGADLNVTKERVRQLETRARGRIREMLRRRGRASLS